MALNAHLITQIVSQKEEYDAKEGKSELHSHADMIVFGEWCWKISRWNRSIDVTAFVLAACGLEEVPIVDAIIEYVIKKHTRSSYLLWVIYSCWIYNPQLNYTFHP